VRYPNEWRPAAVSRCATTNQDETIRHRNARSSVVPLCRHEIGAEPVPEPLGKSCRASEESSSRRRLAMPNGVGPLPGSSVRAGPSGHDLPVGAGATFTAGKPLVGGGTIGSGRSSTWLLRTLKRGINRQTTSAADTTAVAGVDRRRRRGARREAVASSSSSVALANAEKAPCGVDRCRPGGTAAGRLDESACAGRRPDVVDCEGTRISKRSSCHKSSTMASVCWRSYTARKNPTTWPISSAGSWGAGSREMACKPGDERLARPFVWESPSRLCLRRYSPSFATTKAGRAVPSRAASRPQRSGTSTHPPAVCRGSPVEGGFEAAERTRVVHECVAHSSTRRSKRSDPRS